MKNNELTVDNIDVFCEKGVFGVEDTRKILEAGKSAGLAINFHGDELHPMKAAEVNLEFSLINVMVKFWYIVLKKCCNCLPIIWKSSHLFIY